jgi:hypothetical protein
MGGRDPLWVMTACSMSSWIFKLSGARSLCEPESNQELGFLPMPFQSLLAPGYNRDLLAHGSPLPDCLKLMEVHFPCEIIICIVC